MFAKSKHWAFALIVITMVAAMLAACAAPATTVAPTQPPAPTATTPPKPTAVPPTAAPTAVPTVPPTAAPTTPPVPKGEVVGAKPVGDGKLTMWVAGNSPDIQKAFDLVKANFEKNNPAFKLTVEYIGWGDLSTKLNTAFAGQTGPDIFMHGVAASAGFISKDQIIDLTPYFSKLEDKDDFFPNMVAAGTVQGKLAMMPVQVTNYMLMYRKDLYTAAGLDPTKPPKTWDELLQNAIKLTKTDKVGISTAGLQMPYEGSDIEMAWAPILRTEGGDLLAADGKKAAFNSDAGKKALQFYVDLFQKNKVSSLIELPGDPNASVLGRGAAAQVITGQFELATIAADPKAYSNIAVVLPPVGAGGKPSTMSSFSGFMINKFSKNKDDAWTLMRHIVSPTSLTIIDSVSLFLPPRASLMKADWVTKDPLFKIFADALQYGQGNPNIPKWVEVRNTLVTSLVAAVNNKATVADALKTAEEAVNKVLAAP